MKEILMHYGNDKPTSVYGLSNDGTFVGRRVPDYYEAAAILIEQTNKDGRRDLSYRHGRSSLSGGDGVEFYGAALLEVTEEYWQSCTDEFVPSPECAEKFGGMVRKIRRQMSTPKEEEEKCWCGLSKNFLHRHG